jgi:hypothetical protein
MEREECPAQHCPSPHQGVEGSRRASLDQVTLSQPCPPASPSGIIGWSSRRAGSQQVHSPPMPPHCSPPRTAPTWPDIARGRTSANKRPLQHCQPTPSLTTSNTSLWATKRASLLKVVPATRKSAFFAASPFCWLGAASPPTPSLIDTASVGEIVRETMASLLPSQPAPKRSARMYATTTSAPHCIATDSCPNQLPDSTTAGQKNMEAPLCAAPSQRK